MLVSLPTRPLASAEDCQWHELHPCNLEPWQPCHQRMPRLTMTIEEALLQGVTLLCSPQQEASLLTPQPMLMDNHIKMMDALQHLDTVGLQFICKSVEALCREITPTQAPPGYCMQQASNILHGIASQSHSLMSHEFYRVVSNLGTAIVEPQLILLQQCPAGDQRPDPEIVSAIANMQRHEEASQMPPTSRDQ